MHPEFRPNISALLAVLVALCCCVPVAMAAFVTELTEDDIEHSLQTDFPAREYAAFARVTLLSAEVKLTAGSQHLRLIIPVEINIPGEPPHRGEAQVNTSLNYKPVTGELFFAAPELQSFSLADVSEKLAQDTRQVVEVLIKNTLPLIRIYQLKEHDLNHSLSKSLLKSQRIEETKLILEFGFD